MAFRFLHLADVHLETRFGGRPRTRERLRRATLEAFAAALDHAARERLHAVLVAGDLFDEELLSIATELELVRRVRALAEAGTWFLCVAGNHDPGAPGGRAARLFGDPAHARIPSWRERVHFFDTRTPQAIVVSDERGEDVGVVLGAGHSSAREAENLAARFHKVESDLPLVGLLHSQVEGAQSGLLHQRYAPSTAADFQRLPYAYFALGHVHLRQQAVSGFPAWYAGNLQGRNAREHGAKGGLLVEAHAGAVADPSFLAFAPVRWERLVLRDLQGEKSAASLCDRAQSALVELASRVREELAVRVELAGPSPLAGLFEDATARASLEAELGARAGLLEVELSTEELRPLASARPSTTPSSLSTARELLERARHDDALLAELAPPVLAGIEGSAEAPSGDPAARLAYLRELLQGLEHELHEQGRSAAAP